MCHNCAYLEAGEECACDCDDAYLYEIVNSLNTEVHTLCLKCKHYIYSAEFAKEI